MEQFIWKETVPYQLYLSLKNVCNHNMKLRLVCRITGCVSISCAVKDWFQVAWFYEFFLQPKNYWPKQSQVTHKPSFLIKQESLSFTFSVKVFGRLGKHKKFSKGKPNFCPSMLLQNKILSVKNLKKNLKSPLKWYQNLFISSVITHYWDTQQLKSYFRCFNY